MNKEMELPENWQVFTDAELLAQKLTQHILQVADKAISEKGAFHFITAGGSTPNRCYQLLSQSTADWTSWHIYMGDERVLPFVDSERNSQALLKHWLSNSDIPADQIHFMNTEAGMQKSAELYAELVESVDSFDLCLLGMGEDGHTASLFPGHENGASVKEFGKQGLIISESGSPKPPSERVSLNYLAFRKVDIVLKVVSGQSKQLAVQQWLRGEECPISKVKGKVNYIWVSRDVFSM